MNDGPGAAQIIFLSILFVVSAAMFAYSVVDLFKDLHQTSPEKNQKDEKISKRLEI